MGAHERHPLVPQTVVPKHRAMDWAMRGDEAITPAARRQGASGPVAAAHSDPPGPVRLGTLATIRWIAVAGQGVALLVVHYAFGLPLPFAWALGVVALSAVVNLATSFGRSRRAWLKERTAAWFLAYDVLQLSALLYLTGGLANPFALLILAPITVSATNLSGRSTWVLGLLSVVCASVLAVWHLPLPWGAGGIDLPPLFSVGIWTALVFGIVFLATYAGGISTESRRMSEALGAAQAALAREQQLSALGAQAAAAAHELGSPLATIAIAAKELARDVPRDSPVADDIALLLSESNRCGEILARLSRRPSAGTGDTPYSKMPVSVLVHTIAETHGRDGVTLNVQTHAADDSREPDVLNRPEFIHGLGNLIQNAVQFARQTVAITAGWSGEAVSVSVLDDGPGFAPAMLARLGEPFVSSRGRSGGHMGLGVFIAQTILEHTGAALEFRNRNGGGASVVVRWPRAALEAPQRAVEPEDMR